MHGLTDEADDVKMRICLLYNANAGDGVSSADLRALLEEQGHELMHVVENDDDLEQALDESVDLVVAAGGDGTVSRVASAVAGRSLPPTADPPRGGDPGLPFAILPLGTANNIAQSFGIGGDLRKEIARWRRARPTKLDLGVVHGSWGESRFIEGVGAGLIPSGIAVMDTEPKRPAASADEELQRALRRYLEVLAGLKPRPWRLVVDGSTIEDEFLLVEVLNIRSVGPNLKLGRGVNPSDGWLSVVTAEEAHRSALAAYLENRLEGRDQELDLPTRRAKHIDIEGLHEIHIDDRVRHWPGMGTVSIAVEPDAVRILV